MVISGGVMYGLQWSWDLKMCLLEEGGPTIMKLSKTIHNVPYKPRL